MQKDSLKKKDKETSFENTKKASAGKLKKFKKGTILQREGDKSLNVYIIEKGLLKSYVIDEKGKEHIFMFASEGWIISDVESHEFEHPAMLFI